MALVRNERGLTFVGWFQLGELRRFSVGDISVRALGSGLAIPDGGGAALFLETRSGCV